MSKTQKYQLVLKQIQELKAPSVHSLSLLVNSLAVLKAEFDFFWIGFYFWDENKEELYLGPFQGGVACTNIPLGKGACGEAYATNQVVIVPDVSKRENYIACSPLTQSEIVIPFRGQLYQGVLDIDSKELDAFDQTDAQFLSEVLKLIVS